MACFIISISHPFFSLVSFTLLVLIILPADVCFWFSLPLSFVASFFLFLDNSFVLLNIIFIFTTNIFRILSTFISTLHLFNPLSFSPFWCFCLFRFCFFHIFLLFAFPFLNIKVRV